MELTEGVASLPQKPVHLGHLTRDAPHSNPVPKKREEKKKKKNAGSMSMLARDRKLDSFMSIVRNKPGIWDLVRAKLRMKGNLVTHI